MSFATQHNSFTSWYEEKFPRPIESNQKHPFRTAKSDVTRTRENIERAYTSKSNTCPKCFTQRSSITKQCLCD